MLLLDNQIPCGEEKNPSFVFRLSRTPTIRSSHHLILTISLSLFPTEVLFS
jgi:hypothetical protein